MASLLSYSKGFTDLLAEEHRIAPYLHESALKFNVIGGFPERLCEAMNELCKLISIPKPFRLVLNPIEIMANDHSFLKKLAMCCQVIESTMHGYDFSKNAPFFKRWNGIQDAYYENDLYDCSRREAEDSEEEDYWINTISEHRNRYPEIDTHDTFKVLYDQFINLTTQSLKNTSNAPPKVVSFHSAHNMCIHAQNVSEIASGRSTGSLSGCDIESIEVILEGDINECWNLYYNYAVFITMSMLYVPNLVEMINIQMIPGGIQPQYNHLFNEFAHRDVKLIEHSNHWFRFFTLKILCENGILYCDYAYYIAFQYIRLILQDRENYPNCKYCSQKHETINCQFMNNWQCIDCCEFADCDSYCSVDGQIICDECLRRREIQKDQDITNESSYHIAEYEYEKRSRCPCGERHNGKFHKLEKHFCTICENFEHIETKCPQLCNCSILYCHSRYDCPLAQTDCKPGHHRKQVCL
jgi:hypothetical protein